MDYSIVFLSGFYINFHEGCVTCTFSDWWKLLANLIIDGNQKVGYTFAVKLSNKNF